MVMCYIMYGWQKDTKKANDFSASANEICFEYIQLQKSGLHIPSNSLTIFHGNNPANADEHYVMMMVREGEILLVTDPKRVALMRSAEELQFRQDELKEDGTRPGA